MNTPRPQPQLGRKARRRLAQARPGSTPRRAFTLIELLVVISIISLLVGLSFPYIRGMLRSSQEQMAAGSISTAISATRAYATRYKPFVDAFQGRTAEANGDGYSGAALIITPANELRVSENDEQAENNGARLELPPAGSVIYNGYRPIDDLDDLLLSRSVTVLGIVRSGNDQLTLLPPPFAVAFSRRGDLMTQTTQNAALNANLAAFKRADGFVYYDGDGDGNYNGNQTRQTFVASNETLEDFRRGVAERIDRSDFNTRTLSDPAQQEPDARGFMQGRRKLPFEKLEAVVGIVIFQTERVPNDLLIQSDDPADVNATLPGSDIRQFHPQRAAEIVIDTTVDNNLLDWAASSAGGEVLFFNRRTGADLRR